MGMTNEVAQDKWTEIQIHVPVKDIETAGSIANMVVPYGIYIEDYSALEAEVDAIAHIDLIEESLLQKNRAEGIIHVYINPEENPTEAVAFLAERLTAAAITHEITMEDCLTEDWQNNWKQYYHAMSVGEKLLICPVWETAENPENRAILRIEPGLAFGTGSHPTTKLCLETMEAYVDERTTMLDIGCGSGILSIAALLLGAQNAFGVDIDSLAVKTALANAKENGFTAPQFQVVQGNLSDKVSGKFNLVVANIVADIIMQFNTQVSDFLTDDGIYITGGIIDTREEDVCNSFAANGFTILDRRENNGWLVFVLKKA